MKVDELFPVDDSVLWLLRRGFRYNVTSGWFYYDFVKKGPKGRFVPARATVCRTLALDPDLAWTAAVWTATKDRDSRMVASSDNMRTPAQCLESIAPAIEKACQSTTGLRRCL